MPSRFEPEPNRVPVRCRHTERVPALLLVNTNAHTASRSRILLSMTSRCRRSQHDSRSALST